MAVKACPSASRKRCSKKLTYVADYEGRSLNSHLLVLIRNSIKAFEAEHGPIEGPIDPGLNVKPGRPPVSRNNTPRHLPGRAAENFPLLESGLFFFHHPIR